MKVPVAWKPLPSLDVLKSRLQYNPETGELRWRHRVDAIAMWNTRYAGQRAGYVSKSDGYVYVCIDGEDYLAHRIAYKLVHGVDPANEVDHRNGVRSDNRAGNLRHATPSQNRRNMRPKTRRNGLPKGVYFHKARRKYVAQIKVNRKVKYLGIYESPSAAHEAYVRASKLYHGDFGRVA